MNTSLILQVLAEKYQRDDCLFFPELRIGTGYGKDAEQRIDAWAMYTYPSKHFHRIAFEIKVSRGDFLAELRQPLKRRYALLLSNEFYFVAPPNLIKADELPPEAGLIEIYETATDALTAQYGPGNMYGLRQQRPGDQMWFRHPAPHRDTLPPPWRFVAAITRRALKDGERKSSASVLTPLEQALVEL